MLPPLEIAARASMHLQAAQLPLLVLAALLAAAPMAAAAAVETTPLSCQSPLWSSLPLAKQRTPADEYDPSSTDYYQDWTLKHVLPPFIFCCLAAALLLAFLLWRLARLATCVRCIRSPRLRGKPAMQLLSARGMRWLRAAVPLLALGMVGGAGYGFSTIQPSIEPAGVAVYEQTKVGLASRHPAEPEAVWEGLGCRGAAPTPPAGILHSLFRRLEAPG